MALDFTDSTPVPTTRRVSLGRWLPAFFLVLGLLTAGAPALADPVVVRADRLLDVDTGELVSPGVVVVEGERIVAVGGEVPAGAEVLDLGDRTLLPGLIDAHVHLAISNSAFRSQMLSDNASMAALRAAVNARLTLHAGFTTVRDVAQVYPFLDLVVVALGQAQEQGLVESPRIVAVGHALSITGGHIDPAMHADTAEGVLDDLGPEYGVADGVDEVVKATRYQIKHGAKAIKISATAGVMSLEASVGAQQYTEEEMRAIVEEAGRHDIRVAAHAHGTEGIKAAVRAGVASIEHGSILDDEAIQMMKDHGTYLVPTAALMGLLPLDQLPPRVRAKAEEVAPQMVESHRRAIAAGVPIALGTDAPLIPHGRNALELATMVELGMSPLEALRSATVHGAGLLGTPDRGRLAPGLLADLVAVPGNPLDDITVVEAVDFVMLGGQVVRKP